MDVPQTVDARDVLAPAVRRQIFEVISAASGPLSTAEVAGRVSRHPNGVRTHLERLQAGGLVVRSRPVAGRGRPGDRWAVAPGAQPGGDPPTAYRDLVRWLVRVIPPSPTSLRAVEREGERIGAELGAKRSGGVAAVLSDAFSSLGFDPAASSPEPGSLTVCLGNCPYRDVGQENFEVVCRLHRGLTAGLIKAVDPKASLTEFTPKDPAKAGCLVGVSGLNASAV